VTLLQLDEHRPVAELSPEDRRAAALAAATAAAAAGRPLSGAELGRRFDRSGRWGREVLASLPAATGGHPSATDSDAAATEAPGLPAGSAQERPRHWLDTCTTLVVALVAAAASYGHMYEVAMAAGEPLWIARAWPITVDGLALVALRRGDAGRRWLIVALAISIAANIVAQFPDVAVAAGPLIAGWPPVALYGTHRLLHRKDYP
jgi:hypothetical protein